MAQSTFHLHVVSAERSLFSGPVRMLVAVGLDGELGIYPKHAPLMTGLKPGALSIKLPDGSEEILYVGGGILEVQPDVVTVLADIAERTEDLDQQRIEKAIEESKKRLENAAAGSPDYAKAQAEFAEMAAQFSALSKLRKKR